MIYSTTEIDGLNEIYSIASTAESDDTNSQHLYWYEDSVIVRDASNSNELSEIGITDGYQEVSACTPLNSEVELNLDEKTISINFEESSEFSISYRWADDEDNFLSTEIYSLNSGNTFSAVETEEGILITSDEFLNITIITIYNDEQTNSLTFSTEKESVLNF